MNMKKIRVAEKIEKAGRKVREMMFRKEPGIDGILVSVGLCIIALLLCVVMKDSLVTFIETTAMGGYDKLMTTCEAYQQDAASLQATMLHFEKQAQSLQETISEVDDAIRAVDFAMEENAKGVSGVTETVSGLTQNMMTLEEQANKNQKVSEELDNEVHKFKLQ